MLKLPVLIEIFYLIYCENTAEDRPRSSSELLPFVAIANYLTVSYV